MDPKKHPGKWLSEVLLVAAGLRRACLLEAGAAAAAMDLCREARAALRPAHRQQTALVRISENYFVVNVQYLRQSVEALRERADAGLAVADCCVVTVNPTRGVDGSLSLLSTSLTEWTCRLYASVMAICRAIDESGGYSESLTAGCEGDWTAVVKRNATTPSRSRKQFSSPDKFSMPTACLSQDSLGLMCPVAFAGWLLQYAVAYDASEGSPCDEGSRESSNHSCLLDGEPLTLCTAEYDLSPLLRLDGAPRRCISKVTFSIPTNLLSSAEAAGPSVAVEPLMSSACSAEVSEAVLGLPVAAARVVSAWQERVRLGLLAWRRQQRATAAEEAESSLGVGPGPQPGAGAAQSGAGAADDVSVTFSFETVTCARVVL